MGRVGEVQKQGLPFFVYCMLSMRVSIDCIFMHEEVKKSRTVPGGGGFDLLQF